MNSFMMGYPHHHVQAPMGSSLEPKFPPGEDYANGYGSLGMPPQSPEFLHHQPTTNGYNQNANNYAFGQHFYHHHNHYSTPPQIHSSPQTNGYAAAAAAAAATNGYYGSYYTTTTHNAPIMDLPIQCPSNVEPQNTALGLQELGRWMGMCAVGGWSFKPNT